MSKKDWRTEIEPLLLEAAEHDQQKQYFQAIQIYQKAYDLIPEPKQAFEVSTLILFNMGEISFINKDYKLALNSFSEAVKCNNGLGNSHIHLRLGQLHYERGEMERAKDEFMRAYMGGGALIFQNQDPKYFLAIKNFVDQGCATS